MRTASSSLFPSSDGRDKWRKLRREPQVMGRQKQEDEDEGAVPDEYLEQKKDPKDNSDGGARPHSQYGSAPEPFSQEREVSAYDGVRCSDFPLVMRRILNRPHPSIRAIVALELVNELGESKSQDQGSSFMFLENVSHGQLQTLSAVPPDCPGSDMDRPDGGNSAYGVTPPRIMEGCGVVKRFGSRSHVVPMHSDWFSTATVHRLERQVVPHFFSGKSSAHTPEKYIECRNYVVAKYIENPEKRHTVYDFMGLVADNETEYLSRIVRFLDHWGIINYCAAAPSHEQWNSSSYLTEESNGEIHVPSADLKSIDSLFKFDKPKCKLKADTVYSSPSCHYNNVFNLDNRIFEHLSENHCNSCSQSLPTVCYQSHKEVDIMLCLDCFHDGRHVIGHSSLDFTRLDSRKDYGNLYCKSWTDQETLLLLEAVEMYNENWNEIAEHVGTKSKPQCILHFLRLPAECGFLENIEVPGNLIPSNMSNGADHGRIIANANEDSAGSHQEDADFKSNFPFADSGNPVMSLVAFLASSVGPRVAAACAHASLAALSEDSSLYASEILIQQQGPRQRNCMNSEIMHGRDSQAEIANSIPYKEEKSTAVGSRGQIKAGATPLSAENVKAAAKAGLVAASTKAKLFSNYEEREIQRLSANIINYQLKRLELKLKQFTEMETFLLEECEQLETIRQRLLAERSRCMESRMGNGGVASSMSLPAAAAAGFSMVKTGRQQVMSASLSQASISGYNNQPQQFHPHVSFMLRQQMFGMGPRLPLAAIQSPLAASPNVTLNASGNPQPNINHL